jgi:hypothetical protein
MRTARRPAVLLLLPLVLVLFAGCADDGGDDASSDADTSAPAADSTSTTKGDDEPGIGYVGDAEAAEYVAEVWADNWFALYVDGELVGEDSVPITTERSFNAETITFTAVPGFTIGVEAKDYVEDDTGLEYIGTDRQQMGDAGLIVQITDAATGEVVAASGDDWVGSVTFTAPTNPECETSSDPTNECRSERAEAPTDWADHGFDDSSWAPAVTYTADEVGAKEGYDEVDWDPSASLIWSDDLETDNTILFRATASG